MSYALRRAGFREAGSSQGNRGLLWLIAYYAVIAALCLFSIERGETQREKKDEQQKVPGCRKKQGGAVLRLPGAVMILSAMVMTAICRAGYTCESGIRVTVLDVGQGEGIYIRGPSGGNYFVDGGKQRCIRGRDIPDRALLLSCAVDTLDYVFLITETKTMSMGLRNCGRAGTGNTDPEPCPAHGGISG